MNFYTLHPFFYYKDCFKIFKHDLESYGLPEDTSAVINVAGQNILDARQRWSSGFKQNVWNSRVKTTKALADAIQNTKATSFVTISGVAYYKPNDTVYTEESKCESYDFLSSKILNCFSFFTYNINIIHHELII